MNADTYQKTIEQAWEDRSLLKYTKVQASIEATMEELDQGSLRIAEPIGTGWKVNEWLKKAVLLYFAARPMEESIAGPMAFYDKIPLKQNFKDKGVRVVPPAAVRYGAYVSKGAILMPSYVNIGAYVDAGTMIDINAVVGSCAQIGKDVHVSARAVIGGVLEPPQAKPVIIEDGAFIGAGCAIVEGVHVGEEAVIGANVTITGSTPIIDATQKGKRHEYRSHVPARSVVITASYGKEFPGGKYYVPCALIIGQRTTRTNRKVSLNAALREYNIS
ncbi:MAG: 2,3,4,5-tetrahydropyridine-2,6-dicarboxylate N-succinyltransferase [Bacteroidota bacterium]